MDSHTAVAGDRRAWPWLAAAVFCLLLLGVLIVTSLGRCQGHFGYPMDDTYIHMAMAKNFSLHGVWGTTKYGFTSSTSSPFYTLILSACYLLRGVHEETPLVLNLIAAIALLIWCDFVLNRADFPSQSKFYLLAFLVFAIPLPILIIGGMEHVLHALFTLMFVHECCLCLACGSLTFRKLRPLLLLSPILVMTRYEGLFLTGAAGLLFLMRGHWKVTLGLAVACAIPVCGYGAISLKHGWFPLPTSLLLKANLPSTPSSGMYPGFLLSLMRNASRGSHILMLVVIAAILLYSLFQKTSTVWTYNGVGLMLFVGTALLHLTLARTGWFFRYEAYLIVFGVLYVAGSFREVGIPRLRVLTTAALILFACLITARSAYAFYVAPQAIADIYDQQYQMGLFAKKNLNGRTLLINDIGAVSFLSDAKVLDLIGLGSLDPAVARMRGRYSSAWLQKWVVDNHATAAIVYPGLAPRAWQPLETWTIPGNYMSGSDSVNFFALDPSFKEELQRDLRAFHSQLPKRVVDR